MIYVFDTSAFITLKNFYPSTFPSLWTGLDKLIAAGQLVSVREVLNELDDYNDADFIQNWAKQNKKIFAVPSGQEQGLVQQILAVPHFQALIGSKAILKGTPVRSLCNRCRLGKRWHGCHTRAFEAQCSKDSKRVRALQGQVH